MVDQVRSEAGIEELAQTVQILTRHAREEAARIEHVQNSSHCGRRGQGYDLGRGEESVRAWAAWKER